MDYGIDLSHYNAISDAHAVRAAGITYAWCKATEGSGYVDPTFAAKVTQLRTAGIAVGAYHFLDGSDAAAQARHFRQVAGDHGCLAKGALMPMADAESAGVRPVVNEVLPAFYDIVAVTPQDIYGNLDWWTNVLKRSAWGNRNFLGHIARYNGDPGAPGYTDAKMAVHQHTSSGLVNGIPGHVDRNATMGGYSLAQIIIGGVAPVVPPGHTPTTPVTTGSTWTVRAGDTLSRIASAWNVTVSALAAANGIANPDLIQIGEVIHRPGTGGAASAPTASTRTYVVRSGDTLSAIAAAHGTSVPVLVALNRISNPDRISVNQVITLPAPGAASPPVTRVYVVRSGDTLGAIAARLGYPGGYPALAARNGITPPKYVIHPGQQLHY